MMKHALCLLPALLIAAPTPAQEEAVELTTEEVARDVAEAIEDIEELDASSIVAESPAPVPPPVDAATGEGAAEAGTETAEGPEDNKPKPPASTFPAGTMRFHLMDGTIITGKLNTDTIPVRTEFGELVVPISAIESFAPGLDSHPKLDKEIQELIQKLGSPNAKERDKAQGELTSYGEGLIDELQLHANDGDAERKVRIATIIEELFAAKDNFSLDEGPQVSLLRLDTIVTANFTVAGNIKQDTFNIKSKFGELVVKLEDIKGVERITSDKPEVRRSIDVAGSDMAGRNWKNTGIRVNRGDRLIINADGQVTLTPWGNNVISGPDGVPQNGMYNGKIPMGALAGRIGDGGEEFLVGSKKSMVVQKPGTLYLGFAMQQNWQNYQFPGKYEARIRVVPAE